MTSLPSITQSSPQYIAELFRDKEIGKVAIIDDADDPRSDSELYANEKPDFWADLDFNNEEAKQELIQLVQSNLKREIGGVSDINDEVLQLLWASRRELKALRVPVEQILFPNIIQKTEPLDSLERHLVDELKVSVVREGTTIDVEEKLKEVSIVFIDYVLGVETDATAAIERAEKIADRIYRAFSADKMPLIILMSSDVRAAAEEERFRDKSGLLRGMFYFSTKADLTNQDRLFLSLAAWAKTLPTSADIQRFVKTLQDELYPVFDRFIRGVKALSLDDYAYIQHLSLQEDGQPLGDYLLWLYNSYLGHLLFENHKAIRDQQKVVDGLTQHYLSPSQNMPSNQFVKMYHSALFNMNVGDLSAHPIMAALQDKGISGKGANALSGVAPPSQAGDADKEAANAEQEVLERSIGQEKAEAKETNAPVEAPTEQVEESNSAGNDIVAPIVAETAAEPVEAPTEQVQESNSAGNDIVAPIVAETAVEPVEAPTEQVQESNSAGNDIVAPIVAETAADEPASLMPYLRLGDIFIDDSESYVLMVINAECDLAFGPSRTCDLDGTVMFVRGELVPPENWGVGLAQTRTELFEYEGRKYRIVWDIKRIFSYRHRDVKAELTAKSLKRKARLRLPFALDVQRAFAANLTRIGMPVGPPIYHRVRLEVWGYDEEKKPAKLIEARDGLAFWILVKKDNKYSKQFFLTVEFAQLLKTEVNNYIEKLKSLLTLLVGNDDAEAKKQSKKLSKRIKALVTFKLNYENWFLELKPVLLPSGNELRVLYPDVIGMRRGWQPQEGYQDQQQIMINVIDGSANSVGEEQQLSEGGAAQETHGVDYPLSF